LFFALVDDATSNAIQRVIDLCGSAIWETLLLAAPLLIIGLVVGLVISIGQAVTQIQEMTLSFVPKILLMIGSLLIFLPWMTQRLMDFTINLMTQMAYPIEMTPPAF
jgi:flagellar biosynthetic protein FliQ